MLRKLVASAPALHAVTDFVSTFITRNRAAIGAATLFLASCARGPAIDTNTQPQPLPVTDGRRVLRAMHDRYSSKWYMGLAFAQNTVFIGQNGRETKQVWNEYIQLPGRLRIDYLPLSSKSGVLYTDGKMYAFAGGKPQPPVPGWNPLLVLMGDVYTQLPDTTAFQLDSLGFDLGIARRDTWEGKPAWVVGAQAGDTTSSQFWVDADSLLVRRIVQRDARGARPIVTDTHFQKYQSVGGFPIAYQMRFYRDGRLYFKEDYFNVKVNETLPVEIFEPASWSKSQIKR